MNYPRCRATPSRETPSLAILVAVLAMALFLLVAAGAAKTISVPGDYPSINPAIRAASPGDTIVVHKGVYPENLVIGKSLTLVGDGLPALKAKDDGNGVTISADNVVFRGFQVTNTRKGFAAIAMASTGSVIRDNIISDSFTGLNITRSRDILVKNNIIEGIHQDPHYNGDGILLNESTGVRIVRNAFANNWISIHLNAADANEVSGNTFYGDNVGMLFGTSSENTVSGNTFMNCGLNIETGPGISSYGRNNQVTGNTVNGKPLVYLENRNDMTVTGAGQVILLNCQRILVTGNSISRATVGIQLWDSDQNTIQGNRLVNNNRGGISLTHSSGNELSDNVVVLNDDGIHLAYSDGNTITRNNVSYQNLIGISLLHSTGNAISLNLIRENKRGTTMRLAPDNVLSLNDYIDNNEQVTSYQSPNSWNTMDPVPYSYNGKRYSSPMGNYWSDYVTTDTNNDGIADSPYVIKENNEDFYPRAQPLTSYTFP
ncbi:MAG TPA: NosD domain-containing protein [Methanomicrobiales archaeon]|nr:NosD domain-containing protein [Methanomicrobiales archaeon]